MGQLPPPKKRAPPPPAPPRAATTAVRHPVAAAPSAVDKAPDTPEDPLQAVLAAKLAAGVISQAEYDHIVNITSAGDTAGPKQQETAREHSGGPPVPPEPEVVSGVFSPEAAHAALAAARDAVTRPLPAAAAAPDGGKRAPPPDPKREEEPSSESEPLPEDPFPADFQEDPGVLMSPNVVTAQVGDTILTPRMSMEMAPPSDDEPAAEVAEMSSPGKTPRVSNVLLDFDAEGETTPEPFSDAPRMALPAAMATSPKPPPPPKTHKVLSASMKLKSSMKRRVPRKVEKEPVATLAEEPIPEASVRFADEVRSKPAAGPPKPLVLKPMKTHYSAAHTRLRLDSTDSAPSSAQPSPMKRAASVRFAPDPEDEVDLSLYRDRSRDSIDGFASEEESPEKRAGTVAQMDGDGEYEPRKPSRLMRRQRHANRSSKKKDPKSAAYFSKKIRKKRENLLSERNLVYREDLGEWLGGTRRGRWHWCAVAVVRVFWADGDSCQGRRSRCH